MGPAEHIEARVAAGLRGRGPAVVAAWSDDLRRLDTCSRILGQLEPVALHITEGVASALERGEWQPGLVAGTLRRLVLLRLSLAEPWAPVADALRALTKRLRHAALAELAELPVDPESGGAPALLRAFERVAETVERLWTELAEALDEQELAHRMRYGQQLASFGRPLAHDLRNHAYAVQMQLRLLSEEHIVHDPAHRERLLSRAREAVKGIGTVSIEHIERWLAEPGPPSRPVVFAELLAELVQQLRAAHPRAEVLIGGAAPCRRVPDGDRIWLALHEIAAFALSRSRHDTSRLVVRAQDTLDAILVELSDDGPPLDPIELGTLFDPPRPDGPAPGALSGLWVARRALAQLGGEIQVHEGGLRGLVFTLTVPRVAAAAHAV